jgi:hypothetical protein
VTSVYLSKDLISSILGEARELMTPAVRTAEKLTKVDNAWGQRIYDTLFGDVKPLINQLPEWWFVRVNSFDVRAIGDLECNLLFYFPTPQPWPHLFPNTELACTYVPSKPHTVCRTFSIHLKNHLVWGELFAEVSVKQKRVQEAALRRKEFVMGVKDILTTCTTLNQACKIWPPLWELVPNYVRSKYPDLPTQRTRLTRLPDVDLNKLTAIFTATKLGV